MDQLSLRTKWPKSDRTPTATTDASVLRSIASIGGLITIFYDIQTGSSESSSVPDFQQILVSMTTNMQRYFFYYETLTLPAVLSLFAQHFLRADLPFPFTTDTEEIYNAIVLYNASFLDNFLLELAE